MEFPQLGDQCSEKSCRQLDFLPVKCDGCKQSFCNQHWTYEGHSCPTPRLKDVQVPVCPMCDKPVACKPGAIPDEAVSRHLDRDCKADHKKNPRCSKARCKVRELIKVDCDQCGLNFCLKHRFPQDHECTGKKPMNTSARAAIARQMPSLTRQVPAASSCRQSINGALSEDEALARALSASLAEGNAGTGSTSQEEQDRMLALALAQSEREAGQPAAATASTSSGTNKSCQIS